MNSKCGISMQEYQSKKLLEEAGLNIQRFQMASSPEQAHEAGKVLCIQLDFKKNRNFIII